MFGFKKPQQSRLKEALERLQGGKTDRAITELLGLAKEGSAEAEYWLADINEFTLKNLQEAACWYRRAAEHGHAKAQRCMADLYMTGQGIEHNPKEAIRLYHAAAEKQIPEAQFVLGEFYRCGDHVEQNTDVAFHWYQQSARAGYEPAEKRIQQFWPNGVFQERREEKAEKINLKPLDVPQQSIIPEVKPLFRMIVEAAKQHGYIPEDEFPFVPELQSYRQANVNFICSYINDDMKTSGLDSKEMLEVFRFVFRRGFDAMYQWHNASDGRIDNTIIVGNPFNDERYLQLPDELRSIIDNLEAPRIIYEIMESWWVQNGEDLREKGFDIWQPLTASLVLTFDVAVSIALKMFGYRK